MRLSSHRRGSVPARRSPLKTIALLASILLPPFPLLHAQTGFPRVAPSTFVKVDGAQLYFEECGTGPRALLLMHDGVVNSAVWDDVWPKLCERFHVIRYDRRGYGRSSPTTIPYYEADDVAAVLYDRHVTQAAIIASSHGGNVAMTFALRYPSQVSELVLVGAEAKGFPYSENFTQAQAAFEQAKDPVEIRATSTYFIAPGNDTAREHLRRLLRAFPQDYTHNDQPLPETPVFPNVHTLKVPTLIVTGSADIPDNQAVAGALVMAISGAVRVVVPNAGHLLYLEKAEMFATLVTRFLELHGF